MEKLNPTIGYILLMATFAEMIGVTPTIIETHTNLNAPQSILVSLLVHALILKALDYNNAYANRL